MFPSSIERVLAYFASRDCFPLIVGVLLEKIFDECRLEDIVKWPESLRLLKEQDNFIYARLAVLIERVVSALHDLPDSSPIALKEVANQTTAGLQMSFHRSHLQKLQDNLPPSDEEVAVLAGPSFSTPRPGTPAPKRKLDTDTSTTAATGKGRLTQRDIRHYMVRRKLVF